MRRKAPYAIKPLGEAKLSWLARRKLYKHQERRETGLLLHAIIRTPSRSMSSKKPGVAIREGESLLFRSSAYSRLPKWVSIAPGAHDLAFHAYRSSSGSSFTKRIVLAEGNVLVVVCEPIQAWQVYGKSPSADTWYLGIA